MAGEIERWALRTGHSAIRRLDSGRAPAAALARRPYHACAAALGGGLALATCSGALTAGAASLAGATAAVSARAAGRRSIAAALLVAGMVVIGASVGLARVHAIDSAAARPGPAGAAFNGTAILLEHPRRSLFGSSAMLQVESGPAAGARMLGRVDGRGKWPDGGQPGIVMSVRGTVERPSSSGSFDWRAYLRRRGVAFELSIEDAEFTGRRRGGVSGAVDAVRRRAEQALGVGVSRSEAAIARGMVLGEDEAIGSLERDDFRRSGLSHVLAVSGQNVMLLCALALPLLGWLGAGPRTRVVVLLGLVAVYVPLAGAGPSLQRAGVMAAAGLLALAAGRASSRWYALELAAVATLAINPRLVGDAGWQLSFAAVVGILILARPLQAALRGLPRLLAEGIAVTLAATLATAPLIGHDFGSVSLVGLAANLAGLPVVAGIMWVGMLECALAQLPPALAIGGPLIDALGSVDGVLLGLLRSIVRTAGDAPGATVVLPLGSRSAVAIAYGLIAAAAVAMRAVAARVEPRVSSMGAAWRRVSLRGRGAILAGAGALVALGWSYANAPGATPHRLTVSFLDVGQGDATLIQDGYGASVLFDGGPPEARVYRLLRAAGVARLDLMVATHQSRDHQGGLHEVLARIPTRLLLENSYGTHDPDFHRLLEQADRLGVRRMAASAGQVLNVGRLTIRVLNPPARAPGSPPPDDPNDTGVAAIVSEGSFDLWLSADAESGAILPLPLRPVEAMKVSHHGSADPGLPQVLHRLRPRVAAIEVGAGNSYGHPAAATVAALARAVPHVYRTDLDGTVTLTVDPDGTERVRTER